jgi:hypothetical protein
MTEPKKRGGWPCKVKNADILADLPDERDFKRFYAKVDMPAANEECWKWTGSTNAPMPRPLCCPSCERALRLWPTQRDSRGRRLASVLLPRSSEAVSRFLESADVERLTGYVMPSFQLKWCRNNGVQAYLSARGEVMIPVVAIEGKAPANESTGSPTSRRSKSGRNLCPWGDGGPSTRTCRRACT